MSYTSTYKIRLENKKKKFRQELTANYGYMEKYMATEAGIQMLLNVGQAVAGIQDKQEFHRLGFVLF